MQPLWRRRPHYAWLILVSVMLTYTVSTGMMLSFGVLIDPLAEEYGWSRGGISLAYTLQFLIGIPAVLIVGRLAAKISSRRMVVIGAVLFTTGMLLTSTINQLWQFQLSFGVLTGGLGSAPFVVRLPVLVSRWFSRRLGLAIGLMWVSTSLGPALFSPLLRGFIESIGWSQTFIIFGLIGGSLMVASSLFIRDNPQEKGLTPYGGELSEPQATAASPSAPSFSLRQAMGTSSFWPLVAVHMLGCVGHSILLAHMVSIATFSGISSLAAAGVLSTAASTSIISRIGMSLTAERKGGRFTLTSAVLLQTLPVLLLLGARELWLFYLFAVLFGLGYGGEMVGFPIFNRQYYGVEAPLDAIFSYQLAGAMVGMAAGGWLGGALFDWSGVYTWSILTSAFAGLLGITVALKLPRYHR